MIIENLSTLKIHKLTKIQYDRELAAGNIDENALYLTPDEEIDFDQFALASDVEALENKIGDTRVSEQISTAIDSIKHPVDSVNGKTGAITLSASDIGALPNITVTTFDNGKFLRVVDGVWTAASIPNAEEAEF